MATVVVDSFTSEAVAGTMVGPTQIHPTVHPVAAVAEAAVAAAGEEIEMVKWIFRWITGAIFLMGLAQIANSSSSNSNPGAGIAVSGMSLLAFVLTFLTFTGRGAGNSSNTGGDSSGSGGFFGGGGGCGGCGGGCGGGGCGGGG